jgi:hypothetical protein
MRPRMALWWYLQWLYNIVPMALNYNSSVPITVFSLICWCTSTSYPATHPVTRNLNNPSWVLCVQWSASITRKLMISRLGSRILVLVVQVLVANARRTLPLAVAIPWQIRCEYIYYCVQWSVTDINDFTLRNIRDGGHLQGGGASAFNMGWVLLHVICHGC